ncbi:protein ZINC INDUCED FACILITATOR-LIKE 1-like isoform X2 [Phoenix dactylifera]|uniref:Protein ZINC INDUCED FACILITATOR-LIKE 1-like isoform X2 n=1 Tax=Phoenix dactylifera TaxID=42345 RepID=A0A8B9A259_PHODC|nr:protein ZINC INDUCED FACILITATOR-LIKE 1-like isoform X2 [Phoenix dactylifera]
MANAAAPLLEKVYFENCPGCKQEKKKDANPGIPYKEFAFVWMVTLCTALPISILFPFLYFMIRDLHIAKREEDIGFYAGFVGASFMFGRALTSVFWGLVADRYGRKPVIAIGICAVVIFNTLFGLSATYWMAITTRLLLGSLNGLLGPIKAYSIEVCRAEHQALGLSLVTKFCICCLIKYILYLSRMHNLGILAVSFQVSTAWGIGLIIGPAIGGFFAQPAEKYPDIFSQDSFFGRFPYFLPCFCISLFAVGVLILCIWLPETLHMHNVNKMQDGTIEFLEAPSCGSGLKENANESEERASTENLFKNWPLMSSIIVYCVFSLHDMAYTEIFSLWAVSDKSYGGLSFSSQDVGEVLAISGFSLLVYQLFLYPSLVKLLGPIISSRVASVLSIPLLAAFPFMTKLSGLRLSLIANCASLLKNILCVTIITGLFILQNNAVPQHQRGAANGIAMTGMSLFKAAAPAGGGILFSWAQKRQSASFLPGDQMVFFILNVVEFIGLLMTFKPFLAVPNK